MVGSTTSGGFVHVLLVLAIVIEADGRLAQLSYAGHVLMENRSGLLVQARVTPADGFGERNAALRMAEAVPCGRITLGMDKGHDYPGFVAALREMAVTPHVAQNTTARRSTIDWA